MCPLYLSPLWAKEVQSIGETPHCSGAQSQTTRFFIFIVMPECSTTLLPRALCAPRPFVVRARERASKSLCRGRRVAARPRPARRARPASPAPLLQPKQERGGRGAEEGSIALSRPGEPKPQRSEDATSRSGRREALGAQFTVTDSHALIGGGQAATETAAPATQHCWRRHRQRLRRQRRRNRDSP